MIINVLKDGFKTVKENKWVILGMWLPAFIVSLFANGFSNAGSLSNNAASFQYNPALAAMNTFGSSLFVTLIVSILVTLFKVSLQMGLYQSDIDGKFEFKKAFVAFKGLTWISVIGISFLVGLIGLVFLIVFGGAILGFALAATAQASALLWAIAAAFAIVGIALYAYVALGLYFVFLTYYADTKDQDNGLFKAFPTTWKLIKGHRYQLLGLVVLQALMVVVAAIVIVLLIILVSWLVSLVHVTGLAIALAVVLGILLFALTVAVFLFFEFWFTMDGIKFFERLK